MKRIKTNLAITVAACSVAVCPVANASLTIISSVGGAPLGVPRLNFDDLALGTVTGVVALTPNGSATITTTPDAKVVTGSVSGQYAAPYLSGNNGTGFGTPDQANGQDATTYLTSGSDGQVGTAAVTLEFNSLQRYFGLLWGSVDDYNTLEFFNGSTSVGLLTGVDVVANPNGDQGVNGTFYVNINSTLGFDKVVATSSQYAFEFDNVAYNTTPVPEPTTMIAGALLLLPFGASTLRILRKYRMS